MYAYEYMCVCMHSSHIKINAGGKGPNGFTYYFCELKSSHKFCGRHPKSKVININESASRRLQGCEGVFIMLPASWKDEHSTNRSRNTPNPYPREIPQAPGSIYPRRRQTEEKEDVGGQVRRVSFLRSLPDEQAAGWGLLFFFPSLPAHPP